MKTETTEQRMLDQKIQNTLSKVEQLKEDQLVLRFPYEVLKLINQLDITTSLDASYYVQYQIKKRNGSVRLLNEPKPNLKLIQTKLLDLIDYFAGKQNNQLSSKNKLIDGVVAYRKKMSVIHNANFHIGQEFVLKLDIKDFFNQVDTAKLHGFWVELLTKMPKKTLKLDVFVTDHNSNFLEEFIDKLATKLVCVTSLDFHLAQGSPTSGALANYYLTNFDNRLLNYCIDRKLNYSRYSDDITISGELENLKIGNLLGATQYILKERGLRLNKEKTKLLRANRKQIVTGIVVNVKKTAGREYKRTIRQEMYYLKKFREAHIIKKDQNKIKYLENLLGKISWVHSIEKDDTEFKRYKGELVIIKRFIESGKSVDEAVEYLEKLVDLSINLSTDNQLVIEGVEWKIQDECVNKSNRQEGIYIQTKRGTDKTYFDEVGLKNHLSTMKEGWRLPTIEEFKSYLQNTHYDDRKLLGLAIPSDPNLNGIIQMNKSCAFNKLGGYWTSEMHHIGKSSTEFSIGRTVFLNFSKNWDAQKNLNGKIEFIGKSSAFSSVNLKNPIFKNASTTYVEDFVHSENKTVLLQSFSVRMVRTIDAVNNEVINNHFSESFWNSVSSSKKSSKLEGLAIETIPLKTVQDWKSSSMLLSNNQLRKGLPEYPPVLKLDFRNNLIQEFDFEKIPNTVKHLLLDGNEELIVSEIPIKKLASHLHEFTLPKQFENQVDIHFSDIYSTAIKDSKWFEVDSDEKLAALRVDKEMVKHLKITIQPGSQLIETETLFNRLNVFVNLVSLHILIEPKEEGLRTFLNELKGKSTFTTNDLAFIDSVKQNNTVNSSDNQTDLHAWLYGKLNFVASDLTNQKLKNLILDFSWSPGVHFKGDFNLELERYHLLHPGTLPSNLPATSSVVHQPNILVKSLGQKISIEREGEYAEIYKSPKLVYILPFNSVSMFYVFNDLFSLYPKNQRHLENIVLVLTNWQEKENSKGTIVTFFKKSNKYKSYNTQTNFNLTNSFFNFPLLSYSWKYDVYKLNNPFKTILFKPEILDNHFSLETIDHPLGIASSLVCYFNKSYVDKYNNRFSSDNKYLFSIDNFLIVQNIFPNLNEDIKDKNDYNVEKTPKINQFKVLNHFYSEAEVTKNLDKAAIINLIKETGFNPIHLPKKYLKDYDIMLTAAQENPFSIVYAHTGLKKIEDFILNSLKISIRTLVFIDRYLPTSTKGNKIVELVYDYLIKLFNPAQFNYIVNQLNKKVIVDKVDTDLIFKFDVKNTIDSNLIVKSFEDEMVFWDSVRWYSMSFSFKNRLIELAEKNNFFNKDGYFTTIGFTETDNCTYLDLSYKDLIDSSDKNNFSSLSSTQTSTIKTLNLSFTKLEDFDIITVFPSCEVLYLDGLFNLYFNPESLNEKFPKLKQLFMRCTYKNEYEIKDILENCFYLEFVDFRNKNSTNGTIQYVTINGRKVALIGVEDLITFEV